MGNPNLAQVAAEAKLASNLQAIADDWKTQRADRQARRGLYRGKAIVVEHAESCLTLLSRVVGGGSFSRAAPYGQWAQNVRALGVLRPPWGLAYDQLFAQSWADRDMD